MKTFKIIGLIISILIIIAITVLVGYFKVDSLESAKGLAQGKMPLKYFYSSNQKSVKAFGDILGVITKRDNDFVYIKTSEGKIKKVSLYVEITVKPPGIKPYKLKRPLDIEVYTEGNKNPKVTNDFNLLKPGSVVQVQPVPNGPTSITIYKDVTTS